MVKIQKEIRFENDCNAIVDYDELRKAIKWYSDKPQQAIKHIYIHGKYPAVSIFGEKIHVHRLLMMYWLNSEIPSEYCVHHINENRLDSRKENLTLLLNSVHVSLHNKGTQPSEKAVRHIISMNKNRKGKRQPYKRKDISKEKVAEMLKDGYSINKIANEFECDWGTIKARVKDIHENPELLKDQLRKVNRKK